MMPFLMRDPKGKSNLFAWEADFELPVKAVMESLMEVGALKDVPIDVLVAACADLVALSAAKLDAEGDTNTMPDRMQSFCHRVEQTYKRARRSISRGETPWGRVRS